jgi:hypothetical protein
MILYQHKQHCHSVPYATPAEGLTGEGLVWRQISHLKRSVKGALGIIQEL